MKNNNWQVSEFHENGSKKTELLDMGFIVKYKKYFEGGELYITGGAADGKPEGLHVMYFQSGGIEMTINYLSGVKEGQEIKYYESGEKLHVANCRNRKYDGMMTVYFKNGNIQSSISLVDGSRFGETLDYYENGAIRVIRDFSSHDVQEATGFYESGVIQSRATLIKDELDGIFEGYDENGELAIRQLYKDGELLEDGLIEDTQIDLNGDVKESNVDFENNERGINNSRKNPNETDLLKQIEDRVKSAQNNEQARANVAINELQTLMNDVVELLNNSTK